MIITKLRLKNWKNFKAVEIPLSDTTYIIGPNSAGKSNLLDVFRFLRDVAKQEGGGLQKAVSDRGGLSKLRCLHARSDPRIAIDVELVSPAGVRWRYLLEFGSEGKGAQRLFVAKEEVYKEDICLLKRPDSDDRRDQTRLIQTHLEQILANENFRPLSEFLAETTYLHLVPQLLKFNQQIGGKVLEDDPFGQGFLERVARTQSRNRDSKLAKIERVLKIAVPQFERLEFEKDEFTGRPHLRVRFAHFRPNAGWQREDQFSDGTLRLLALLWSLFDGDSLLLLEEPELSLNSAIVMEIPAMMQKIQRTTKRRRQIIISTHSEALLSNQGINALGVLVINPGENGSTVRGITEAEQDAILNGFSVAEVVLPSSHTPAARQLSLAL